MRTFAELVREIKKCILQEDDKVLLNVENSIELSNTATSSHTEGSYLIYNKVIYEVINDIAVGDTLIIFPATGANIKVAHDLLSMIGNLSDLNTKDKSNLVAAINEAMQSGGGGILPHFVIVSDAGSTVTVTTPTGDTIVPIQHGTDHWECDVTEYGVYTVHAVLNGDDAVTNVNVDDVRIYNINDSHFSATINVTFPTDATCRCYKGVDVYYATGTPYSFAVHSVGIWTIECTYNGVVKTETVNITADGQTTNVLIEYASIEVTYGEEFQGITLSCTDGTTTYIETAPSSGNTVTFTIPNTGTWTISGTVEGVTYDTTVIVTDMSDYSTELLSGFNWQSWLEAGALDPTDYEDLDEVLEDEKALRKLFTKHSSVDYLANVTSVNTNITKIFNNDLVAKWINLRDYALDILHANEVLAEVMDEADKYGYGEWVIVDNTTTPPTWGAKGCVPKMTSNSAPYGVANSSNSSNDAYKVFDNATVNNGALFITSASSGASVTYKFTNPICVKAFEYAGSGSDTADEHYLGFTAKIEVSNDGTNWTEIGENTWTKAEHQTTFRNPKKYAVANANDVFALYVRFRTTSNNYDYNTGVTIGKLQFYGRSLSVSVPTMTSNTAPYGTASCSSHENSTEDAWGGFNPSSNWTAVHYEEPPQWLGYEFPHKVVIKMVTFGSYSNRATKLKIQASNNGFVSDIHDLSDELAVGQQQMTVTTLNNNIAYKSYRYYVTEKGSSGGGWTSLKGEFDQFYGLDYSEKEFETGTNKKWLYDHGVELEPMNTPYYDTMQQRGEYTKGDNDITLDALLVSGSSKFVGIATQPIDLTNCSKIFAIAEVISSDGNSSNEFNIAVVTVSGEITTKTIAFVDTYSQPQPYPAKALDVSAVNQSANIGITAYRNVKGKFTELWLEP